MIRTVEAVSDGQRIQRIRALAAFVLLAIALPSCPRLVARTSASSPTTSVFINEIHYDNTGTDSGETIEIAAPTGTDLSSWTLVLYNGVDSRLSPYQSDPIAPPSGTCGSFDLTLLHYPSNGIQNGAPDGLALVDAAGQVVQFLSYEGTFTATGGPAAGLSSTDMGVSEGGNTPEGHSLQLGGTGATYDAFAWNDPAPSTFGACNQGQAFAGEAAPVPAGTPLPGGETRAGTGACSTIPQIQGSGDASPCLGHRDQIQGCISGITASGFYFQDESGDGDAATSDGIYAYFWHDWDNPGALKAGDSVMVSGQVIEYYDATEFAHRVNDPLQVTVIGACDDLPAPVPISPIVDPATDPADCYERFEGMRVKLSFDGLVVGPTRRFASRFPGGEPEIAFVDKNSSIYGQRVFAGAYPGHRGINTLSGGFDGDLPDVRFGERVSATNLTGVLGYHFDKYTLIVDGSLPQTIHVQERTPEEPASSDAAGFAGDDEFAICSYNLQNLFDRSDDSDGDYWDGEGVGDWIPHNEAEYRRIVEERARTIATDLANCTIVAVQEIEANDRVWAALVRAIKASGGVEYEYDYYESYDPRDITVGILYDPARLTLNSSTQAQKCQARNYQVSDGTLVNDNPARIIPSPCTGSDGDYALFSRPPYLARLSVRSASGAETLDIVLLVNHFKSKRGDEATNLPRREAQARHVVDLMAAEHRAGRPNVVALGDFNDTLGSTPLQEFQTDLDGRPLINLFLWHVPRRDRYTFIFAGESEVLDHMILSAELNSHVRDGGPLHINADLPDVGTLRSDNCPGACSFETGRSGAPDSAGPGLAGHRSPDHDPVFVRFGFTPLQDLITPRSFQGPFAWPLRLWYNSLERAFAPCLSLPTGLEELCITRAIAR